MPPVPKRTMQSSVEKQSPALKKLESTQEVLFGIIKELEAVEARLTTLSFKIGEILDKMGVARPRSGDIPF